MALTSFRRTLGLFSRAEPLSIALLPFRICDGESRQRRKKEIQQRKRHDSIDNYESLINSIMGKKNYVAQLMNISRESDISSRLDMYDFVGITEYYAESCTRLAGILGLDYRHCEHHTNQSCRSKASSKMSMAPVRSRVAPVRMSRQILWGPRI